MQPTKPQLNEHAGADSHEHSYHDARHERLGAAHDAIFLCLLLPHVLLCPLHHLLLRLQSLD